ncbi:nucleotide disphospho-sugar-binding domain-containing protein [Streptomyces inhibens]|uniref:nucleotide disphospho-sugar-binding domain-containing protein n=1 Tax=Streptomyces inhibens TaxID=2293571 RepID=UPI001EE77204|nr:nucleotide disphospho-sugar-binding domain-containing protein [Streptomyces inhibens]UKY51799.1 DUF1205 domain-containing protein [Streptomyces inhibens]
MTSADGRLRVLFSVYPFPGHLFPLVSTAWALRSAGHEVLLAGFQGPFDAISKAGLPVAEVVDFDTIAGLHRQYTDPEAEGAADADPNPITGLLSAWSDAMADGTVDLAKRWQPDLVVHDVAQGAGPLAASVLSVPAVEHRGGFHAGAAEVVPAMAAKLAPAYQRHGVNGRPERRAVIDVVPPSMAGACDEGIWPVRYVPYGSGGLVPDWLIGPAQRPRVAVTLGTTAPEMLGIGVFSALVDAAGGTNADFVFALGGADPAPLGKLPSNVRVCDWVPLHVLLESCAAIVHQGGIGTTLSALHAGLPQLALPTGDDNFINAEALVKRGVGLSAAPSEVNGALFARLLGDRTLTVAADEVRKEMAATDSPAQAVERLVRLAR